MSWGMFCIAWADGDPVELWLASFDVNANEGRGAIGFTSNEAKALRFASLFDVLETWRRVSNVRPIRPDGLPNRPLTALTIEPRQMSPLLGMRVVGYREQGRES